MSLQRVWLVLALVIACVSIGVAQEKTPQVSEKQLEQWLKQFPEADANKDGKLSIAEATAYYQKLQQQQKERPKPTVADVKYGPYRRNVLDLYQAKSEKPTPVLINFHGGGFVGGDKASVNPQPYVNAGISVVSANYRFVKGGDEPAPYPAPMLDGARVVQFIRSKAKEWNIDPERIALTGGSAGGIITLWIGYHDDLARPDSSDPIERQSTRVSCLVPMAAPTSLDLNFIRKEIGGNPIVHPSVLPFFGVSKEVELATKEKQRDVEEASPLKLATADDPPTFSLYMGELSKTPLPANTDINTSIHHPQFGVLLKQRLDELGVENQLVYPGDGRTQAEQIAAVQAFLRKHLIKAEVRSQKGLVS